jgi:hypothetical protein
MAVMPMAAIPTVMMPTVVMPVHLSGHFRAVLHGRCRCRIAQRNRCRTFDRRTQRQDRAEHGKPQDLRPVHSFILHPMSRRQRTLIVRSHGASLDMRGLNAA